MRTHELFSKYVIGTFLTDDKKGEFASLVIDEQFMESAANIAKISRDSLVKNLCSELFAPYRKPATGTDSVITIVALQLYAASKCEADGEYSANAYNPRLCEILNCDLSYLQSWYKDHQENVWNFFYEWCDNKDFRIQKCQPKPYKNRFIQYPLELAKYLFNREDLKYIASVFNKYKLQPFENIFYSDFWNIIDVRFDFGQLNNRIPKVLESVLKDIKDYAIIRSQVYNYYLVWDGEYIAPNEVRCKKEKSKGIFQIHLSDKNNIYRIDIRKEGGSKIANFQIDSTFHQELSQYYAYKRDGIIIFQNDRDGDLNYWDETRFIEDKNESGLAIISNEFHQKSKFNDEVQVFHYRDIVIYEFKYNDRTKEFYSSEEKTFELIGGLKIAGRTYIVGGEPILRIQKDCTYLMNGESKSILKGDHHLALSEGEHSFKFPRSKELKITIVPPSNRGNQWSEKFFKWEINKRRKRWHPTTIEEGIVGLNFESYSRASEYQSILKCWAKTHRKEKIDPESNISLKLLNNINRHE